MKIKSIQAPDFKGRDIKLSLSPLNLIVGANFEGKSAIPQAIEVANYGALLSLGETNDRTFRLSSDARELFVHVIFDDGLSNMLALSRSEDGSIKKKEDRAHELPRVMMDAQEYFEQTEQERLKYVLQRTNMKRCGYDEEKFYELLFTAIEDVPLDKQLPIHKSWEQNYKLAARQRDDTKSPIIDFMDALLLRLKKAKSEADRRIKDAKPGIATLEKSKSYENVSKDRSEAHEQLVALQSRLAHDNTENEIAAIENDINADENIVRRLKDDLEECDAEEAKMRALKQCPTCKSAGKEWLKPWLKNHAASKENLQKGIDDARASAAEQRKKLEALQKKKPSKEQAALKKRIEEAQHRFDDLDAKQLNFLSYEKDKQRLAELRQKTEDSRCESLVLASMIDSLVSYQKILVEKAFTMLLKTANQFTDGLLKSTLCYHDGSLGYWADSKDHFVHHATFSGTEKLLAYAGLQIALSQESPCKYIVFDEMGRIHPSLKVRVVTRLLSLIEDGTIDQAFLIDTTRNDYQSMIAQLQLIELN